jgi:hypothetical protein
MRLGILGALVMTLAGVSILAAADASFTGTWKLNLSKSQLAGQTVTLSKTTSGAMHFDSQGFAYDFDLTGKEYPMPDGGTTSWRSLNDTTWEAVNRANGKVIATYRVALSGNTMTAVMKVGKPDGTTVEQTQTLTRVSGGPGFLGKWKSTEVKGAPTSIEISTTGANGITVTLPEFQMSCKGAFDGKDYAVVGGGANLKQAFAFERLGPNSFRMTTKLNGKPFYVDVMTLSADGRTLTDEGNAISVNEPVKAVYDRQ